jgi:hypothetical protein
LTQTDSIKFPAYDLVGFGAGRCQSALGLQHTVGGGGSGGRSQRQYLGDGKARAPNSEPTPDCPGDPVQFGQMGRQRARAFARLRRVMHRLFHHLNIRFVLNLSGFELEGYRQSTPALPGKLAIDEQGN